MSSLALISSWYYICTSYCTPDTPLIPAKSPKEVKEIFKFFKKNSQLVKKKNARKSYI